MGDERTRAAAAEKGAAEPTAHSHQSTSARSMPHTERLSTARAGGARPDRLSAGLEQRAGLRQSPSPPRHRWSWRRRIFRACTLSRERVVLRPEHTEDTKSGLSTADTDTDTARCRARSRRPSSRRAGRARGIIGCVEATEHVQRLAGGIDRLASACGLTAPQPGCRCIPARRLVGGIVRTVVMTHTHEA